MAGCGGSSSESEEEVRHVSANKRITGKSFSIDTLLRKSEPPSCFQWERIFQPQSFLTEITTKQICPVPPNILVPRNLFHRAPTRRSGLESSVPQPPDLPDSSGSPSHSNNRPLATLLEGTESTEEDSDRPGDEDIKKCSSSTITSEDNDANGITYEDGSRYKRKRPRTAFSVSQIRTLEAEFERNRYLTGSKRKELSKQLKLSETQIKIWFQNRRTKLKRKNVSEMETWVQQLYSPLGPMAPRPLVIGDQLYLFNNPNNEGLSMTTAPCVHLHPPYDAWRVGPSWS